ncbi:MAG: PRC-barrel domain-containing protein [Anaerolineales bacterium]|jgi:uncharacterized protein YrrD
MIFKQGTMVKSADDQRVGQLERVVIDPRTRSVSHIVIEKGFLFTEQRVIPVNLVESAEEDQILLRLEAENLNDLPEFVETNYIQVPELERQVPEAAQAAPFYPVAPMPAWRHGTPIPDREIEPMIQQKERHIPDDTVAVQEGADVYAVDDRKVGDIEEVLTDPESHRITQFVISEGLLLKEEKRIPIEWVSEIDEEEIHLAVGPKILEYLPSNN